MLKDVIRRYKTSNISWISGKTYKSKSVDEVVLEMIKELEEEKT